MWCLTFSHYLPNNRDWQIDKKLRELLFRAHTKFGLTCSTSEKTLMMFKPVSFLMSVWVQLVFLSSSATRRGYVLTSSRPSGVLREWESVRKGAHKCCSNITLALSVEYSYYTFGQNIDFKIWRDHQKII